MASSAAFERNCKVIALLDMDSFECQVHQRFHPEVNYYGVPCVVVDQSGRIVSATHEARKAGISRDIRRPAAEAIARRQNIDLKVFVKPNDREKPDAKEVRYASWHVVDAIKKYKDNFAFDMIMEYASSDEFYLDLTAEVNCRMDDREFKNPYAVVVEQRTFLEAKDGKLGGSDLKGVLQNLYWETRETEELNQLRRLIIGGLIAQEINNFVFGETKMVSSVGVSINKLLAKIAVSLNKPNGITILPFSALDRLGKELGIEKIPGFGGTFGAKVMETLNVSKMYELQDFSVEKLEELFGQEKSIEIALKCRGYFDEPVKHKLMNEEVSSGKSFFGQIRSVECLKYHLFQLIEEILDRMSEEYTRHHRRPSNFRFSILYNKGSESKQWSYGTAYLNTKTAHDYCTAVMNAVMSEDRHIRSMERHIRINRIEIRAKGFFQAINVGA